ncbi:MAG TPA: hypothetical protein VGQ95_03445 [Chthoniobacterales bacterium]|nr:hypothetical protein [Chthoniobacterales bacterium]
MNPAEKQLSVAPGTSKNNLVSISGVNWQQVKASLPKASSEVLDSVQKAYEADPSDPARAVELALRSNIAGLKTRFESLKKENQNEPDTKVLATRKGKRH